MYWLVVKAASVRVVFDAQSAAQLLPPHTPWRSLVSNEASAHWSGRQSSALFAETSARLRSLGAVKNCLREVLFSIRDVERHSAFVWSSFKWQCMFTGPCMCCVHVHVHESSLPFWKGSFTLMGSYSACECRRFAPKYMNMYLFVLWIFTLTTSCLETGSGMHLVICPTRLASDCCAWAPI